MPVTAFSSSSTPPLARRTAFAVLAVTAGGTSNLAARRRRLSSVRTIPSASAIRRQIRSRTAEGGTLISIATHIRRSTAGSMSHTSFQVQMIGTWFRSSRRLMNTFDRSERSWPNGDGPQAGLRLRSKRIIARSLRLRSRCARRRAAKRSLSVLAQPHAGSAALPADESDPTFLKRPPQGGQDGPPRLRCPSLELAERDDAHLGLPRQIILGPIEQGAGSTALGWGHSMTIS
jgi:hypothetical protein